MNRAATATALTVVEIDVEFGRLPNYRVADRHLWLGIKHTTLHACPEAPPESFEGRSRRDRIRALAGHWHALKPNSDWAIVIDAANLWFVGIGAGLASFLEKALPDRVIPVVFSNATKSRLGWAFLGAVETGRYRDYIVSYGDADTRQFWHEVERCQYEVLPGPGERIRWGVWESPAGACPERSRRNGAIAPGHDDLLVSAALCSILDQQDWPGTGTAEIIHRTDPLAEIDRTAW